MEDVSTPLISLFPLAGVSFFVQCLTIHSLSSCIRILYVFNCVAIDVVLFHYFLASLVAVSPLFYLRHRRLRRWLVQLLTLSEFRCVSATRCAPWWRALVESTQYPHTDCVYAGLVRIKNHCFLFGVVKHYARCILYTGAHKHQLSTFEYTHRRSTVLLFFLYSYKAGLKTAKDLNIVIGIKIRHLIIKLKIK